MTQLPDRLVHTDARGEGLQPPAVIEDLPQPDVAAEQTDDVRGGAPLEPDKKRTIAQGM